MLLFSKKKNKPNPMTYDPELTVLAFSSLRGICSSNGWPNHCAVHNAGHFIKERKRIHVCIRLQM